jgi:hypothetical protein
LDDALAGLNGKQDYLCAPFFSPSGERALAFIVSLPRFIFQRLPAPVERVEALMRLHRAGLHLDKPSRFSFTSSLTLRNSLFISVMPVAMFSSLTTTVVISAFPSVPQLCPALLRSLSRSRWQSKPIQR